MKTGSSRRPVILVFLGLLVALKLTGGAFQNKKAGKPLQHEVAVTLKLVQVHVQGADGKPVLDLEKPDFLLWDNGRPQTITDFEKHALAPAGRPPKPDARPAPRQTAALMTRKFFFLFDYMTSELEGVAKSKKVALHFLESHLQPDDEVAVLSYSEMNSLTLHEYLTTDHAKVRRAMASMTDIPGVVSPGIPLERLGPIIGGMELMDAQMLQGPAGSSGMIRMRGIVATLKDLAKAFRTVPGPKNIVFFSRGFGGGAFSAGSSH